MTRTFLATAALGLALSVAAPRAADAAFVATMEEVGNDVVVTGFGTLNVSRSDFVGFGTIFAGVSSAFGSLSLGETGFADVSTYRVSATGPLRFGTGGRFNPDLGSGDFAGVSPSSTSLTLFVPRFYIPGDVLAASMTFLNKDFTDLGVTAGSHVWSWGSGGSTDTYTLNILAPTPVPAPPALALFGVGLVGLAAARRRRG